MDEKKLTAAERLEKSDPVERAKQQARRVLLVLTGFRGRRSAKGKRHG